MTKIKILIPVYNDWKSLFKLLENIDNNISKWDADVSVLIVNDSSTDKRENIKSKFNSIRSIKVLNMKINKGHARCNASGLKYLVEKEDFDYVILMDGDGEDRPEELDLLFKKSKENPNKAVTANRIKRSEGFLFKLLYEIHKILTYVFTGKLIKFGNYSCLPKEIAARLIKESCIWSSYSGSVTKIIPNRVFVPSIRGIRYFGPSQMNLQNLLIHSFSIIAVFKNTVILRSILFLIIYLFLISNKISIITLFPVVAIFIFVFIIYKISSRENIHELNDSLENINSIDNLSNSNSR
tara:strand:- start:972 stop:1859 length:888 start_codon:yes stop_codon:yes gene_type:complete